MVQINKEKGITLIALIITIIVLLILAGVSIAMLTGENGILTQATEAKKQATIGEEKEQIALAYNATVAKQMEDSNNFSVTATDLNTEFEEQNIDATASGENPITVEFNKTGNVYTIDENNEEMIKGPTNTEGITEDENNGETSVIPEGYIKPSGIKTITENGEHDVSTYEKANVNVPTYEPNSTLSITEKNSKIDVSQYQYVDTTMLYTQSEVQSGKGTYWNGGTETIASGSTVNINVGFIPSYIVFTRRSDACDIIYNANINTSKQYIRSIEYNLNRGDTGIVSISSNVRFYAQDTASSVWDWFAVK